MLWADRLGFGIFVLGVFVFGYLLESLRAGATLSALVSVIVWIVSRTLDFVFGGPERRKQDRERAH
jgi:hypothetical protein